MTQPEEEKIQPFTEEQQARIDKNTRYKQIASELGLVLRLFDPPSSLNKKDFDKTLEEKRQEMADSMGSSEDDFYRGCQFRQVLEKNKRLQQYYSVNLKRKTLPFEFFEEQLEQDGNCQYKCKEKKADFRHYSSQGFSLLNLYLAWSKEQYHKGDFDKHGSETLIAFEAWLDEQWHSLFLANKFAKNLKESAYFEAESNAKQLERQHRETHEDNIKQIAIKDARLTQQITAEDLRAAMYKEMMETSRADNAETRRLLQEQMAKMVRPVDPFAPIYNTDQPDLTHMPQPGSQTSMPPQTIQPTGFNMDATIPVKPYSPVIAHHVPISGPSSNVGGGGPVNTSDLKQSFTAYVGRYVKDKDDLDDLMLCWDNPTMMRAEIDLLRTKDILDDKQVGRVKDRYELQRDKSGGGSGPSGQPQMTDKERFMDVCQQCGVFQGDGGEGRREQLDESWSQYILEDLNHYKNQGHVDDNGYQKIVEVFNTCKK